MNNFIIIHFTAKYFYVPLFTVNKKRESIHTDTVSFLFIFNYSIEINSFLFNYERSVHDPRIHTHYVFTKEAKEEQLDAAHKQKR